MFRRQYEYMVYLANRFVFASQSQVGDYNNNVQIKCTLVSERPLLRAYSRSWLYGLVGGTLFLYGNKVGLLYPF